MREGFFLSFFLLYIAMFSLPAHVTIDRQGNVYDVTKNSLNFFALLAFLVLFSFLQQKQRICICLVCDQSYLWRYDQHPNLDLNINTLLHTHTPPHTVHTPHTPSPVPCRCGCGCGQLSIQLLHSAFLLLILTART